MKIILVTNEIELISTTKLSMTFWEDNPLRRYSGIGNAFPVTTSVKVYKNGKLLLSEEVVKHDQDKPNQKFAIRTLVKKLFKNHIGYNRENRKLIWKEINYQLEESKDE